MIPYVERLDIERYDTGMSGSDSVDFCIGDITSRYDEIQPEVEGVISRLSAICNCGTTLESYSCFST